MGLHLGKAEEDSSTHDVQFLLCGFDVDGHVLDVVVNAIEHSPLIYDHPLKLFENVGELDDALSDIVDLSFSLRDGRVICVEAFEGGLLKR